MRLFITFLGLSLVPSLVLAHGDHPETAVSFIHGLLHSHGWVVGVVTVCLLVGAALSIRKVRTSGTHEK